MLITDKCEIRLTKKIINNKWNFVFRIYFDVFGCTASFIVGVGVCITQSPYWLCSVCQILNIYIPKQCTFGGYLVHWWSFG